MFQVPSQTTGRVYRMAVIGLLLLSAAALGVTIWVELDFLKEQELVEQLIKDLPSQSTASAEALAGELRWQFRLVALVVLNLVVTGIAVMLLWRAYSTSQESLRDVKALASDILSNMDQGVITTDLLGRITTINRRGLDLLDCDQSYLGRPLAEVTAIPLNQFLNDWLVNQKVEMTRDYKSRSGGKERILRTFCQMLNDADGDAIGNVLQVRDVSERVLIDDRMRRMERYMGLGSLAGGLHHEIKNPLAALSLHVQLLEEQLQEQQAADDALQMFAVIKSEVSRIGSVLKGFQDFASLGNLNLSTVDIVKMIEGQVELLTPQARLQQIDIKLKCPEEKVPAITGDRVRLEQVLLNLIVNAVEAMPEGGSLVVNISNTRQAVVIMVSDSGPGIPQNLQDKILDPYFTTKSEGTGLGLAICDKIVRQHQGTFEFLSDSSGTTFQIVLPRTPVPPD